VGAALIAGGVDRHPEQVGHRVALRLCAAHALHPQPGFLQRIQRQVVRAEPPPQALAKRFVVFQQHAAQAAHGAPLQGTVAFALRELPERQRAILIAARVEHRPIEAIAAEHGVSARMIGKDLKKALQHCAARLDRPLVQRFGPGAGKPS